MIRTLEAEMITATAERLHARVADRFPERGLTRVAADLVEASRESAVVADGLGRPMVQFRLVAGLGILCIFGLIVWGATAVGLQTWRQAGEFSLVDALQTAESAVNDLIFLAIAIFFLVRLEQRFKRARALNMLHKLRSLAHIIDMHQLTKDPDAMGGDARPTAHSPVRDLDGYELKRYFDYCSEMLSVLSKMAALLVEHFDDPVTLAAVNEVENLTSGLARKIWQKIMVASSYRPGA
jgi:hypothetical protein